MEPKNEVLLSGNINPKEVSDIQTLFPGYDVIHMETKGISFQDFVQIIFHDFNVLSFGRDFVLSHLVSRSFTAIKKLALALHRDIRPVRVISYEVQIKADEKEFVVNITCTPGDIDMCLSLTDTKIEEIVALADHNSLIQVKLNDARIDCEILKF